MSNTNTGGPAFTLPSAAYKEPIPGETELFDMTLRDYFAAKAMQGLCAGFSHQNTWPRSDQPEDYEVVALHAYLMADALLKAREAA